MQSNELMRQITNLKAALEQLHLPELADKAESLVQKGTAGTLHIAFCGHFSAGKSTLINRMCGVSLLPSSPIPTSANIVSIRSADREEAVLKLRDGSEEHVSIQDVLQHAKNGEQVREVELRAPIDWLGERGVLLDTPGVDSTDDNHQQSTESALHLADIVVFVMDYNHVLSEMNMDFAKRLSEMGKPLIMVINQIDKHREEEVPFDLFKQGVADAFRSWGIVPAASLYTTMKQPDHPYNEAGLLRALLGKLVELGTAFARRGIASAAVELVEEAGRALHSRNDARREQLLALIAGEAEGAQERYEELQETLAACRSIRSRLTELLKNEAGKIAENANITPATTRDLAQSFLESRQAGFRVGFLFTQGKTEEERKRRLDAFYADFLNHVTAQILWHVKDAVKKTGLSLGLDEATVEEAAELVRADLTPEWLVSKVRSGAVVTGEYVLNYSKEIANDVRTAVKRSAVTAAERLADAAEARYAQEMPALLAETEALEKQLAHRKELAALEASERETQERLISLISEAETLAAKEVPFPQPSTLNADTAAVQAAADNGLEAQTQPLDLSKAGAASAAATAASVSASETDLRGRFEAAAAILEDASGMASSLKPLASAARALKDKAQRLRDQRFTVALFGAFSAGKSSFANALLGEPALPVSPNPTTATINTVVPPTSDWPHGTARVTMKSRETVLQDIRHSLQALGLRYGETDEIPALLKLAERSHMKSDDLPPGAKPHLAFLQAASAGWEEAEPLLDSYVRADRELFRKFVAEERKSAFVERIELHYESALSRQGVTLVDTPGADSINARHTGVAFNYMKSADAIFFVTYYNHAFSRADRQFLEQLGRVKDAFEMDKMFFIVNAADLAADEEELQAVLEHVRGNLASFGIRNPRLFPMSSLMALDAKQRKDIRAAGMSGIIAFEDSFRAFAASELAALTFRAAESELSRAAETLRELLRRTTSGAQEAAEALQRLEVSERKAKELLQTLDLEFTRKEVTKEMEEQLYYIKQRFQFRFGDWVAASFNPATLREDRGDIKRSLAWAWQDAVGYIQKELVNEVLAAALRLEKFMNRSVKEAADRWNDSLAQAAAAYKPLPWEELAFTTPAIESVWRGDEADLKLLTSHYKSSKQFFAGDGRVKLREALEKRWEPMIEESLQVVAKLLREWIESELSRVKEETIGRMEQALADSLSDERSAWEQPLKPEDVEQVLRRMNDFAAAFRAMLQGTEENMVKSTI